MPAVKEIQLVCTPEQWEVLCFLMDAGKPVMDFSVAMHLKEDAHKELIDKISAINKRLVFASSIPEGSDDSDYYARDGADPGRRK